MGIDSNIRDTRVTISGLLPNTTYRIYVSAVNRVETSDGTIVVQVWKKIVDCLHLAIVARCGPPLLVLLKGYKPNSRYKVVRKE